VRKSNSGAVKTLQGRGKRHGERKAIEMTFERLISFAGGQAPTTAGSYTIDDGLITALRLHITEHCSYHDYVPMKTMAF